MDVRIDVITLAVADLDRTLAFYRDGLGLHTEGVMGTEWLGRPNSRRHTVTWSARWRLD
jgi:catechol 2,3-dioxygenase-like lactoylglutathione lyase family enzyme